MFEFLNLVLILTGGVMFALMLLVVITDVLSIHYRRVPVGNGVASILLDAVFLFGFLKWIGVADARPWTFLQQVNLPLLTSTQVVLAWIISTIAMLATGYSWLRKEDSRRRIVATFGAVGIMLTIGQITQLTIYRLAPPLLRFLLSTTYAVSMPLAMIVIFATKLTLFPNTTQRTGLAVKALMWPWEALGTMAHWFGAMPRILFRYRIAIAGNLVVVPIPIASILYILGYRIAAFSLLTLVGFGILLFFAFVFSEDENNNHAPATIA